MRKFVVLSASLVVMLVALLAAGSAQALNSVSFVKSTGSGTACTLAAPCSGFPDALAATREGGEIHCLDSGQVIGTTINKSLTIDCAGQATITNNMTINAPGIVVTLRNLTLSGLAGNEFGIDFQNGAALLVENCVIENYITVSPAPLPESNSSLRHPAPSLS
jgi:hypothetical protein